MKAIANTTIRLGLINLPVQMVAAAETANDVKFKQAGPNGEALRQVYLLPDNTECPREQMRKGIEDGGTIKLIPADAIEQIAAQTKLPDLEVLEVVDMETVNLNMYRSEGRYYVQSQSPKKGGNYNAFKLFVDALDEEGKALVTKWTPRSRQTLMVLYPYNGNLVATSMTFASDVRQPDEGVEAHKAGTYTDSEMNMAKQLIGALSDTDMNVLGTAEDEAVTLRVKLVEDALAGNLPVAQEAPKAPAAPSGLAAQLAASLAAAKA